jgi:peptide/nickel transport system permease protein
MKSEGTGLTKYIFIRLLAALPMVLILLTIVFILIRCAPGGPVEAMFGGMAPAAQLERLKEQMGLNQPIILQYCDYIFSVFTGNFGISFVTQEPVIELIRVYFPATLELSVTGMVVAVILGITFGTASAKYPDTIWDGVNHLNSIIIHAIPVFFSGLMFQLVFGVYLGWLPTSGRISGEPPSVVTGMYLVDALLSGDWRALQSTLTHLVLPATTLGLFISGLFSRIVRANLIEASNKDYVRTAYAKGLPKRSVLFKHIYRNALIPIVTVFGMQFALLLGGAVLTETTFSWPGIGRFLVQSVSNRDYATIQGIIAFFALFVVVISLCIDIINSFIDPRIQY